jgi:hypothetical protein
MLLATEASFSKLQFPNIQCFDMKSFPHQGYGQSGSVTSNLRTFLIDQLPTVKVISSFGQSPNGVCPSAGLIYFYINLELQLFS